MSGDGSIRNGLDDALSAWADDPVLSAPLAEPARACLVVDAEATRLLHASSAAAALAQAVSGASGALAADLAAQIRAAGAAERPRMVRLRLDRRRIAPPTACLIARRTVDGAAAILVIVVGPLPAFRSRLAPAAPVAAVPAARPEPAPPGAPAAGDRFVWRSDAEDRITAVTGPGGTALAPVLVGMRWAALAEAGRLSGADGLLAAIRGRRTFRAAPAALDLGAAGILALDLSGARLGRGGEAFSGFGGYGVVRGCTAPPRAEAAAPVTPAAGPDAAAPALPDVRAAPWPPARSVLARFGQTWGGGEPRVRLVPPPGPAPSPPAEAAVVPEAVAETAGPAGSAPEAGPAAQEAPDAALSVTEHAAFREIARALGARYAGDEEVGDGQPASGTPGGAVMPFPAPRPSEPFADAVAHAADAAAALVADLPGALLIHRGDAVLAASRGFLALTGHPDLASLRTVGVARLFRGLPPGAAGSASVPGRTIPIETAANGSRPVTVEHGRVVWQGEPADGLILRPAPEAVPADVAAAEGTARTFHERRLADAQATLDALADGVVTLDPGGRVVAMNRAAAALFACDPREVVGAAFPALFEAAGGAAVGAALAAPGTEAHPATADGRRVSLRVSGTGVARVAVLRSAPDGPAEAPALGGPAFLGRLDREIRTPVESMVGLADGLLSAPHGPMDERDRAALHAIRAAGGHLRGLVADLLDLAAIESGGRALAVRPLPLNDLVSACVELLQAEAARARIVLRTSFSPDLAPLEADEPTLRQAALTVIGGAIRAAGAGGQVIVSTTPGDRGGVALKVRGTGPGMTSEEIEHALEPLGAGSAGTGLGLPLTKALVEANHGRLLISSRKDEGTLVEILLPGSRAGNA